jgi:hypothetical protein
MSKPPYKRMLVVDFETTMEIARTTRCRNLQLSSTFATTSSKRSVRASKTTALITPSG